MEIFRYISYKPIEITLFMRGTNPHLSYIPESNERRIVEEIQDRESVAEVVGGVYELLSLLLQDTRGMDVDGVPLVDHCKL